VASTPVRVAIEVYPHTALVSLFGLGTVLKYKAGRASDAGVRRRRTVDERAREFGRLVQCLLDLRDRIPPLDVRPAAAWQRLVARLGSAVSGTALDRLEDELDAYVCAYVAQHYRARRGQPDSIVIGDRRTGYIVTPVDPRRRADVERAAASRGVAIA
jgi:predicted RNase H-like nuclease